MLENQNTFVVIESIINHTRNIAEFHVNLVNYLKKKTITYENFKKLFLEF